MKKQWFSIMMAILSAAAALLFFLTWGTGQSIAGTAEVVSLNRIPVSLPLADGSFASPDGVEAEVLKSAASSAADGWVVECVDCPVAPHKFTDMTDRNLEVDVTGHPHIAYGENYLYYAWHDGVHWHYETVDDSPDVGAVASLALDEDGHPHISYYDDANDDLKYAYQDGSEWHIQTVDAGVHSYVGLDISLALDGNQYPHISYSNSHDSFFTSDLRYAYLDGSGWHTETVDSGNVGKYNSLALDGDGHVHIVYDDDAEGYTDPDTSLRYAYLDGSGWHTQTVDSDSLPIGRSNSLALEPSTPYTPHVSYNNNTGDLLYAYLDGSSWHTHTLGFKGAFPSLTLNENAYPHFSYSRNGLRYAYLDGSGWHTQTVESGDDFRYTSLDFDGDGYARISYYDNINQDLKYTYRDATDWHFQTVDSESDGGNEVGEYTSLVLDGSGYAHISYYDDTDNDLKYAYQDASGWYSLTVDSDGNVGKYTSLALDGDGYPHISYYDDSGDNLKYAYQDASGWHSQTVDSDGRVGSYTSLALAPTAPYTPHISYYDATNEHLKYAYLGVTGWHSQTVGTGFPAGQYTSLVLGDNGYPHISYYCHFFNDLRYTRQISATGWSDSVVAYYSESWNRVGKFNSLALDDSGDPWISYYDEFLGALRVATGWAPTGWSTMSTVDSVAVWDTSLVMSGTYAHISYYDALLGNLKYAYQDASGWHSQTIEYEGDVGRYTSLALDANGHSHISYYDADHNDLKHVYFSPQPIAAFTADLTTGIAPLTVVFTDTSTGGEVNAWLWSFGDGVTSTLQNPTHTYTAAGAYTVTLAVSGSGGSDAVSQTNYITVYTPVEAAFTAVPTSGPIPLEVAFTNVSSGDYTDSLWEFGDGLTSTLENPTHTYTAAGTYTVTLTVNGPGGTDAVSHTHYITGYTPVQAAFTAAPTSGFAPLIVTFTNTSSGDYTDSLWEFGDSLTSTSENPTHTYTTLGTHAITLTVSGPGGIDTLTRTDYITVYEAVRADFTASPVQGVVPLVVAFTDTSSGPVTVWQWDFGDGAMSALQHPTHTYTMTGVYTVSLTAQVSGASAMLPGGMDTLTRTHYITVTESPPQVDFVGHPRSGYSPLTVQFTSTVTGTVTNYQWNFGDGDVADTPNPTHTYRSAGSFGVILAVTGPGGVANVSKPDYITVNAPPGAPTATFSADLVSGTTPLTVTFTAVTSGTVEHWLWSFGDGATASTGPVVNHTYVTSDTFDVSLTVSNTHGSFIVSKPSYITVRMKGDASQFVYLPLVLRSTP